MESPDKQPFDRIISFVPNDLLSRKIGYIGETQQIVLNDTLAKLPSLLSSVLPCSIEEFGKTLKLSAQTMEDALSFAESDTLGQINQLLLAWVGQCDDEATVEKLLKSLHDSDDSKTVEKVAESISAPDFLREVVAVSQKLDFDRIPLEAQNERSLQDKEQVQRSFYVKEQTETVLPAAMRKLNVDMKQEMVGGDRRMERMQSDIDFLYKKMKENQEEIREDMSRQSLHQSQSYMELHSKLVKIEKENEELKSTISELKHKLQDADKKLEQLQDANKRLEQAENELHEEMQMIKRENEQEKQELRDKVAVLERKNADLVEGEELNSKLIDSLEMKVANLVDGGEELKKRNSKLIDSLQMELKEKNERIEILERMFQRNESEEWVWKRSLGSGGYGEVFLAERHGSPGHFAVKRITCCDSTEIEKQQERVTSFFKEMKVLQSCQHKNIVSYVDRVVEYDKKAINFYLVMEYMFKGSLADLLKKEGKFDEVRTVKYTIQLLEGLDYLHGRSIIHRDIKCSNILLDENDDIKLADFGCVKFLDSSASSGEHLTGTAWWMAPELVPIGMLSAQATKKSDIWSVGATVVEMLTGQRPFNMYKEEMSVIFGLGCKTLPLETLISGNKFSPQVQNFLQKCIVWEPSQRATVKELLATSFCSRPF